MAWGARVRVGGRGPIGLVVDVARSSVLVAWENGLELWIPVASVQAA